MFGGAPLRGAVNALIAVGLTGCALAGCAEDAAEETGAADGSAPSSASAAADRLRAELDDAFRIDLSGVGVTYDWYPDRDRVDGSAELDFAMRPGEDTPIFHFNPLRGEKADEREMLTGLLLDGEPLDPADDADLDLVRPAPGAEPAYEIQRRIDDSDEHTLEIEWSMPKPFPPKPARPFFFQTFDDTQGPKDEIDSPFPTIDSPDELARHTIDLRVHSRDPYLALGSGAVTERDSGSPDVQEWVIDSGREISSSTMFFAAARASKLRTVSIDVDGVEVEFATNLGDEDVARAKQIAGRTIPNLVRDLGPFPVEKVSVLLTRWGSGMEFYAATRSGLGSLRHELGHMYFGTTLVNRTWRDTWWDEAAVTWWQGHKNMKPVDANFSRPFGADRPAAAPGFDTAAYGSGARVFETIAREIGGDEQMMELLAQMSAEQRFEPFTTAEFIDLVAGFDDSVDRARLERWMLARD